jgi:subtilisin family serine protease
MSRPHTSRRRTGIAAGGAALLTIVGMTGAMGAGPAGPSSPPTATSTTGVDRSSVIVQLAGEPLATSPSVERSASGRVNLNAVRSQATRAVMAKERNAFRSWLRTNAPKAKITGEFDFALNGVSVRLEGTDPAVLRKAPQVKAVAQQSFYSPSDATDPDLALIDGIAGWSLAGATNAPADPATWAGHGTKVGIIDSGIDQTHPCFADTNYPKTTQRGDKRFTNNKVVVAKVFNNKAQNLGLTPEAVGAHGTHVSGTVACNLDTPAMVDRAAIPYQPSGVAPGALLGNYNVFPGEVDNARSEDILNAIEAAVEDGMDVLNLSLGGNASGNQDLLTMAIDNVDRAGVVVAVAAGNSGPGYGTVESPGSAERALTAGASSVGQFVGVPVSSDGAEVAVAAIGDFPTPDEDLTAPLGVVRDGGTLGQACAALPAGSLAGQEALVSRGTCSFGTKVSNAENAGAVATIVVNNIPGDPIAMATDPAFPSTIPAVMVGLADRDTLMELDGSDVTLGGDKAYTRTGNDNILADFSSQGPTDVSFRVKPDVVAPGVNVLSSVPDAECADPGTTGCWAFYQGTSMATPHLAGMAAVVRQAHPAWEAWQVRSAIINTAKSDAVMQTREIDTPETDVLKVGSGLANLKGAVGATVAFSSPSISFGAVANGRGATLTKSVTVANLSGEQLRLPVKVDGVTGGGDFTVSGDEVTIAAGGSATVTVTFTSPKKATTGPTQAHLLVGSAHAVLFAWLK